MRKKFIFNNNKKRKLGNDAYLVRAGLRHKLVVPLDRTKKSHKEREAIKKAKESCIKQAKMITLLKTHCDG
jgi:hypothetical protein